MIWHLHSIPWHSFWGTVIDSASSSIMALSAPRVVSRFFGVDLDGQWWFWNPGESYFDFNGCRACCSCSRVKSLVGKFRFNLADPRSSFPPDHQTNRGPKEFGRQETITKITTCEAIGQVQGPLGHGKVGLYWTCCFVWRAGLMMVNTPVNSVNTSFTMRKQLRWSKVRQSVPVVT